MPAKPANVEDTMREPNRRRSVRTEASRVASLLKPVA